MSTASVVTSHNPAAGRQFVALTSGPGNVSFTPAATSGEQYEGAAGLTIGADAVVSGADGTYTINRIRANGLIDAASYQIGVPPQVATVLTSHLPAAGRQFVDLTSGPGNVEFTPAAGSGDQYEGDAALTIGVDAVVSGADGAYTINRIQPSGLIDAVSYTIGEVAVVPQTASVVTSHVPPNGMSLATLVEPINHYLDSIPGAEWASPAEAGEQALSYTADGAFNSSFDWSGETEGTFPYWYINNAGQLFKRDVIVVADAAVTEVPQGAWVIGAITKDQTTASLAPVYSGTDADSYEYTLNGSAWLAFTGTISFSDLVPESTYGGAVRAVNSVGAGAAESFSFVTDRVPLPPVLDVPFPDLNLSELEAIHINLDDYFSRAASYVVAGLPEGSGLALSGRAIIGTTNTNDTGASPLTITVTANNSDGSIQDAFSVSVVDDTPPVLSINSLTTLDTTPIVSGSSGDAVSLVLVVNGVTYNPIPSNGTWIQQLSELPLNTYVMTLNGQDAAGNAAIERKARLKVVNEIVESAGGLFQPLFRSLSRSVNNPMFR